MGALLWLAVSLGAPGPRAGWTAGATAIAVLASTLYRRRLTRVRERKGWSVQWLDQAVARLEDRFEFDQPDGTRFVDSTHAYTTDLGVFGSFSLFRRLNACRTGLGERALASMLDGSDLLGEGIHHRQRAVLELRDRLDVRERFELAFRSLAERVRSLDAAALEERTRRLIAWGAPGETSEDDETGPPTAVLVGLAVAATSGALATLAFGAPWWVGAGPYLFNLFLLNRAKWLGELATQFELVERTLMPWSRVLAEIERTSFDSTLLADVRSRVAGTGAPLAVRDLGRYARALSQRRNLIWVLTGEALLLWDFHAAKRLTTWRKEHGPDLGGWLRSAARIEACLSLATYAAAAPEHAWPQERWEGPLFETKGLAHPLLPAATRVGNDLELDAPGAIWIVTGSNMSGKSTFLRSAGLGVVMANCGLPVPARSMVLHDLHVVTSMVVTESLERGSSRFHAEVLRIKDCLDWAAEGAPALVLLDEILAGTNSEERHLGTLAVLRHLRGLGAATVVSTHDLALAHLETDLTDASVVHFRDRVEDGRMVFDYVLRPGVLPSTNALQVMRAEGIPVDDCEDQPTGSSSPRQ